jgi:hypothetical protein
MVLLVIVGYGSIGLLSARLGLRIARDVLGYRDYERVVPYSFSAALRPLAFPTIAILGWGKEKEEVIQNGKR